MTRIHCGRSIYHRGDRTRKCGSLPLILQGCLSFVMARRGSSLRQQTQILSSSELSWPALRARSASSLLENVPPAPNYELAALLHCRTVSAHQCTSSKRIGTIDPILDRACHRTNLVCGSNSRTLAISSATANISLTLQTLLNPLNSLTNWKESTSKNSSAAASRQSALPLP